MTVPTVLTNSRGLLMDLYFRELPKGEMERDPTQRDQFDNEDVELVDALVREAIQNSLDAKVKGLDGAVRVKFRVSTLDSAKGAAADRFIRTERLNVHLVQCGLQPIPLDKGTAVLVVEDFGTTGLTGRWDDWDTKPFCDFWRRMGRSHKGGSALGRWGLGKLVFSSSSKARVFFGLTVRSDDSAPLLMGQAVLKHHDSPEAGIRYDSHGFYAELGEQGIQLPAREPEIIAEFCAAFDLAREGEAGLSIVVPHLRPTIEPDRLIQGVLRNYFFPILFERLVVEVNDVLIDANSYERLAARYDPKNFADGSLTAFIRSMKESRNASAPPPIRLPANWPKISLDDALGENLELLRTKLNDGNVVEVRAPILLKRKDGTEENSHVDIFLQRSSLDMPALFVRRDIVLNAEQRYFHGRKVFAALIADDGPVSEFLGDAENPAHTGCSASAEKVTANWRSAGERLRDIRQSLQKVHNALISAVETFDRDALRSVFSIAAPEGTSAPHPKGERTEIPVIPPLTQTQRAFTVVELADGFGIRPGAIRTEDLPLTIKVRAAYDVLKGNPFSKHDPADFDFTKKSIRIESMGEATFAAKSASIIEVTVPTEKFAINFRGFDKNRDLIVDSEKVS